MNIWKTIKSWFTSEKNVVNTIEPIVEKNLQPVVAPVIEAVIEVKDGDINTLPEVHLAETVKEIKARVKKSTEPKAEKSTKSTKSAKQKSTEAKPKRAAKPRKKSDS